MPVYNSVNPVAVGLPTKKDHYDRVWNNTQTVRDGGIATFGQQAGDLLVANGAEQLEPLRGNTKSADLQDAAIRRVRLRAYRELKAEPTIVGGTLVLDLDLANHFRVILSANISSITVQGRAAADVHMFMLTFVTDGTPRTLPTPWFTGLKWPDNVQPGFPSTNGKIHEFHFKSDIVGEWRGAAVGTNY
jgi:hypothetical protein